MSKKEDKIKESQKLEENKLKQKKIKEKKSCITIEPKLRNIILINILTFYLVPFCILPFTTPIKIIAFISLVICIFPIYIFITNIVAGFDKKYKWMMPLIDFIMELPILLILTIIPKYFKWEIVLLILLTIYLMIAYLGVTFGYVFKLIGKKIEKINQEEKEYKEELKNKKEKFEKISTNDEEDNSKL